MVGALDCLCVDEPIFSSIVGGVNIYLVLIGSLM